MPAAFDASGSAASHSSAGTLVDNAKQVLPVKTLQAGRISVGWFAAECDECLIVGAGMPLGAERGLAGKALPAAFAAS
jgi:hypothetical protein